MDIWKNYWYTLVSIKGSELIKVTSYTPAETKLEPHWQYITKETYNSLLSGASLESLKESLSENTFKFLSFGPTASDNISTNSNKFIQKAFVTNATANAAAHYAWVYLISMRLNGFQIAQLREKYSIPSSGPLSFSEDEVKNSFVNQSAFFLNLCKRMNENDRFKIMAEKLDLTEFQKCFPFSESIEDLFASYDRRIFHSLLECDSIRSNYDEGSTFHLNTGIFTEKDQMKFGNYLIDVHYLEALDMRLCKKCLTPKNFKLGRKFGHNFT